jgi:hypothetical protein
MDTFSIADDIIRGSKNIAEEIGESKRRTDYLLEKKQIPAGKQGNQWIASRRRLREHYVRLTSGQAPA